MVSALWKTCATACPTGWTKKASPKSPTSWDAACTEIGAGSLQVCTAVMHYGFRIVEDLCDGLSNWMDEKGFTKVSDVVGRSLHRVSDFNHLDLSFRAIARIDQQKCIRCNLCYV